MGLQSRVAPKRSLGQNFFVNEVLIEKIVKIVKESNPKHITEIGPGKGAFTKAFYVTTSFMTLVELDSELSKDLNNLFPKAEIYNKDFLDFELQNKQTTYFGSLPFNRYDEIIKKILKSDTFTNPAYFIVQKEVAEKYINKENNLLGLTAAIYADCKKHFYIRPSSFRPKPNVTSSFISFTPHKRFESINRNDLEKLLKLSFRYPRKTLYNNLKIYNYKLDENFKKSRPSQLKIDDYVSILKAS